MADKLSREEHLAWCKRRALAYLPHDVSEAFASMGSDLRKHPETKNHIGMLLGIELLLAGHLSRPDQMREFIEGFN